MFAQAAAIRIAVFDVDGILTDGGLHYGNAGELMKSFDVRDGMGLRLLREAGITTAIITSRRSVSLEKRAADLGIDHLQQGVSDKLSAFTDLLRRLDFTPAQAAFMGDDLVDLAVMRHCGFPATVPDAPVVVRRHAICVTRSRGGHGAVREFCEILLHQQDLLVTGISPWLGTADTGATTR